MDKMKEVYLMSNWHTKFLKKGFTFDDVLLIPAESHVLPNDMNM
jgi:IMP dehydrogenase